MRNPVPGWRDTDEREPTAAEQLEFARLYTEWKVAVYNYALWFALEKYFLHVTGPQDFTL